MTLKASLPCRLVNDASLRVKVYLSVRDKLLLLLKHSYRKVKSLSLTLVPAPVSAVSAIAARRRLTTPAAQNSEPVESPEPLTPRTNSFSALQTLKPSREGKKSPKKSSQQTPQRRNEGYQRADADTLKAAR